MRLPQSLEHAAIAELIPHQGPMCLLSRLERWDATRIVCIAANHRDPAHPLRTRRGLLAPVVIEYAAQAMALHGALLGKAGDAPATPGFLASARAVQLAMLRLDDLPEHRPDELRITAVRHAGDAQQILYAFEVEHGGRTIAAGRAAVVLNTPLAA
jgi:predicted hotdog family 3-hydroxylacyl-ACP dehydratase